MKDTISLARQQIIDARAVATVDLAALRHNLMQLKQLAPDSKILAMIKADAYGHGLTRVVTALDEADGFGVHCLEEALILRELGVKHRLVLMAGFLNTTELRLASRYELDVVVHCEEQVHQLLTTALPHPLTVWLKVNSGMNRLGFAPEQVYQAYIQLRVSKSVLPTIHFMTHFSGADDRDSELTVAQWERFKAACFALPGPKSLVNSAALQQYPQMHADWVRPGIMLYGVSPFADSTGAQEGLRPVMTLTSRLIARHELKKGDSVGYGGIWTCPEDMPVGVVAMGYGDGYPRHIQNGAPVLVDNVICPLVGRVSMDMLTVDLRPCPQAKPGDKVTLWGRGLPIEKVAQYTDTISYELLCGMARRVRFQESWNEN